VAERMPGIFRMTRHTLRLPMRPVTKMAEARESARSISNSCAKIGAQEKKKMVGFMRGKGPFSYVSNVVVVFVRCAEEIIPFLRERAAGKGESHITYRQIWERVTYVCRLWALSRPRPARNYGKK